MVRADSQPSVGARLPTVKLKARPGSRAYERAMRRGWHALAISQLERERAGRDARLMSFWTAAELEVRSERALWAALGANSRAEMLAALNEIFDPYVSRFERVPNPYGLRPATVGSISLGTTGYALDYPESVQMILRYLEMGVDHADRWDQWDRLMREIHAVEGFRVDVRDRDIVSLEGVREWPDIDCYDLMRGAPGAWTVAEWVEKRVRRRYEHLEVVVLKPGADGEWRPKEARYSPQAKLKTVRARREAFEHDDD